MAGTVVNRKKFNKLLGQRIRKLREQKGISLKTFETKEFPIDKSNLSKIENGERLPSSYTLYIIGKMLDVEVKEFFTDLG